MTQEIKPCPFCGSENVTKNMNLPYVYCENCDAYGPTADMVQGEHVDAIEKWNKAPRSTDT